MNTKNRISQTLGHSSLITTRRYLAGRKTRRAQSRQTVCRMLNHSNIGVTSLYLNHVGEKSSSS
jgi:hypothetical protein